MVWTTQHDVSTKPSKSANHQDESLLPSPWIVSRRCDWAMLGLYQLQLATTLARKHCFCQGQLFCNFSRCFPRTLENQTTSNYHTWIFQLCIISAFWLVLKLRKANILHSRTIQVYTVHLYIYMYIYMYHITHPGCSEACQRKLRAPGGKHCC